MSSSINLEFGKNVLRYDSYLLLLCEPHAFQKLIAGQPLWAKLFYLVRTGHIEEALSEALYYELQISQKERHFITYFKAWVYSPNRQYDCSSQT